MLRPGDKLWASWDESAARLLPDRAASNLPPTESTEPADVTSVEPVDAAPTAS